MHHFFVQPSQIQGRTLVLDGQQAHQIARVLRLQVGQRIRVLDNTGWQYDVELSGIDRDSVCARILDRRMNHAEPGVNMVLFQALLKREKFEWVLQKATEVGFCRIVPVQTQRSLVRDIRKIGPDRLQRWQKIAQEAAEQCARGRMPRIDGPVSFQEALEQTRGMDGRFIAWTHAGRAIDTLVSPSAVRTIGLLIGPEGGFSEQEVALAREAGVASIHLGPRILRTETASIVAGTLLLHACGDARAPEIRAYA